MRDGERGGGTRRWKGRWEGEMVLVAESKCHATNYQAWGTGGLFRNVGRLSVLNLVASCWREWLLVVAVRWRAVCGLAKRP